jgi:hypothetical protein
VASYSSKTNRKPATTKNADNDHINGDNVGVGVTVSGTTTSRFHLLDNGSSFVPAMV